MLLSQIALIVLIVMGIALGYIPLRLGIVVLGVWAVSKLVMRRIIKQVEDAELRRNRMAGARIDVHNVTRAADQELVVDGVTPETSRVYYLLDLTVTPPAENVLWKPLDLALFCRPARADDEPEPCHIEILRSWHQDAWSDAVPEEIRSPLRVQLLVATPPDAHDILISHQQESLGAVTMPD